MRFTLIFLMAFCLFVERGFSQNHDIDSMLRIVEAQPDTERVQTLGWISHAYLFTQTDSARHYGNRQYELAVALGDSAMQLAGAAHESSAYKYLGDYQTAIEKQAIALELGRLLKSERTVSIALNAMGNLYKRLKDFDTAESFYLKAIEQNIRTKQDRYLGNSYLNYGTMLDDMKQFDKALEYYEKAKFIYDTLNYTRNYFVAIGNMGATQMTIGQYAKAEVNFQEGLAMAKSHGDKVRSLDALINLGINDEYQLMYRKALAHYEEALTIAESIPNMKHVEFLKRYIGRVLGLMENYKGGYKVLEEAYELTDSLYDSEKMEALTRFQTEFKTKEKDVEIANLRAETAEQELQNAQLYNSLLIVGAALLILLLAFIIYRLRAQRRFQRAQQAAQTTQFRAVLEAEEKERNRIAHELHDSLGQLLSTTKLHLSAVGNSVPPAQQRAYQDAVGLLDDSVSEVRQISHNLAPPALTRNGLAVALKDMARMIRKSAHLSFALQLPSEPLSVPKEQQIHLYRIIQELVNNSIKHAACSEIGVAIQQSIEGMDIRVWDDGGGFEMSNGTPSTGLGLTSIMGRVSLLGGSVTMKSDLGKGTETTISLS